MKKKYFSETISTKFCTAFSLMLVALLTFGSCKRKQCTDPNNPDCSNYNPCLNKQPVSAAFRVKTVNPNSNIWVGFTEYYSDTISNSALFEPIITDADSYLWKIGAGTYTTKTVSLGFGNIPVGSIIPVALIIHKAPNTACFPVDDGADTVTRNFIFIDTLRQWEGKWQGYYTDTPTNTGMIYIGSKATSSAFPELDPYITGLRPYVSDTIQTGSNSDDFNRQFRLQSNGLGRFGNADGWVYVDSTFNNIKISFSWNGGTANFYSKIFIGHRVP